MKQLSQFILEKLHPSKYNKEKQRPEWSIEFAENGDIVQWNDSELYFIYKCLHGELKHPIHNNFKDNVIVYHAAYNFYSKDLTIGPETGIGDNTRTKNFSLASDTKKEEFIEVLRKNRYEWDDDKKELIKVIKLK